MLDRFWLPGYTKKWICKAPKQGKICGAVHFYLPSSGCQECENTRFLEEVKMPGSENAKPAESILETKPKLKLRLEIDRLRLDQEWATHPQQVHDWCVAAADAELVYAQAKSKLELVSAKLNKEIRDDPEEYDIEGRVTNEVVNSLVILQPEYIAAVARVNTSRHELQVVQAGVNALEHRKRALTMEVELYTHDYYSDPSPRPVSAAGEEFDRFAVRNRGRLRKQALEEDEDKEASK